ncbi:MAG: leucine-rich repeat protein [Treponema sp.]|jgi:uncharacterized repeat protein (TIGR02543 family)|nr:leucine-rich repeat protein [Treponema sp.]
MKKKVFLSLLLLTIGTGVVFAQAPESIAAIEKTIEVIAFSVNETALENWVKDLREKTSTFPREGIKKDSVYRRIAESKAAKDAAISGLAGLAPDILFPLDAGAAASTWTIQAQLAYAVAYTYGKQPKNPNEFKADMFLLLAGEDMLKAAGKEVKPSLTAAQLADAGNIAFKGYFNAAEQKRLFTKIAEKMYSQGGVVALEYALDKVVGVVTGPVGAIKDALFAYDDMKAFAKDVQAYYCEFPKPDGYYIDGGGKNGTGVALQFNKNGTVSVRPRLAGSTVEGNNIEIIEHLSLGGGKYEIDKKGNIKITFDEVSWNGQWKTQYGSRPTSTSLNYVEIEPKLSKKTINGKLTGYESMDLSNYFPGYGDWFLVTRVKDGWASGSDSRYYVNTIVNTDVKVRFDSRGGGTPNPASITRTTNSPYDVKLFPKVTRNGYDFLGWYTYAVGGTLIDNDTIVEKTKEHTLYAHWRAQSGLVTFDLNGVSGPPNYKMVIFDSNYGALPEGYRNGYRFDGWWTKSTGGTLVTEKTKVATAGNHYLFAHWTIENATANSPKATMDKLKWIDTYSVSANESSTRKRERFQAADKSISGELVIPGIFNDNPVEAKNFQNCTQITSVILLDGAAAIATSAFNGCTALTSINIPASMNIIDGPAFSNCNKLTSVTFKGDVVSLRFGNNAFPGDLATLYKSAGGGAGTYTRQEGQNNWTKQGSVSTASGQPTLTKLKWGNVISVSVANYGGNGKMQLVEAASKSISGAVVIPGTYNGNPTEPKIFIDCTQITSVIILDGAVSISTDAFRGCTSLTSVTIPASVNIIGGNAFLNCEKLTSVTFLANTYRRFDDNAFPGDLAKVFKSSGGGTGTYTRKEGQNNWTKR